MENLCNVLSLGGWAILMFHVSIQLAYNIQSFIHSDLWLDVTILRVVQTFQLFDIILILIGKSKGSLLGAIAQIAARNIVAWVFIEEESNHLKFAMVVIIWSMADVNRYLFYLFKSSRLAGLLRYNSFILLYPVGVFGQMLIINDYIQRHQIVGQQLILIRAIQVGICGGLVFLYTYMLNARSKYLSKNQSSQQIGNSKKNSRSRSPKRD